MFTNAKLRKVLHQIWDTRTESEKKIDQTWEVLWNTVPTVQEDKANIQSLSHEKLIHGFNIISELDQLAEAYPDVFNKTRQTKLHNLRDLFAYFIQSTGSYKNLDGAQLKKVLLQQASKLGKGNDGFGLAAINLLVHLEQQKNSKLNCRVMDISDFPQNLEKALDCTDLTEGQSKKIQFIVHNRGHYTTVDFKLAANDKKCIVLDAANDPRMAEIIVHLNKSKAFYPSPNQLFVATNSKTGFNIQSDFSSCPVFALDHAMQISKMDIYDHLQVISEKEKTIDWIDLPVKLVWNAQSATWINKYKEKHHDSVDLTELNTKASDARVKTYINPVKQKESKCLDTTDRLFESYGKQIKDHLKIVSDHEIQRVFKSTPEISTYKNSSKAKIGLWGSGKSTEVKKENPVEQDNLHRKPGG
jgi:hypothetical protein